MLKEKIEIRIKEINRHDIFINIPAFSKEEQRDFINRSKVLLCDTDKWILDEILNRVGVLSKSFQVCFRKPDDFGLAGKIYRRVWDFNSALLGDTLNASQVLNLCLALRMIGEKELQLLLSEYCGERISVISSYEEAGKYCCALDISFLESGPSLRLSHAGGVYFNPETYYAVIPK